MAKWLVWIKGAIKDSKQSDRTQINPNGEQDESIRAEMKISEGRSVQVLPNSPLPKASLVRILIGDMLRAPNHARTEGSTPK
jgi:hypothetical protein